MKRMPFSIERDNPIQRARHTAAVSRLLFGVLGIALILTDPGRFDRRPDPSVRPSSRPAAVGSAPAVGSEGPGAESEKPTGRTLRRPPEDDR